MASIKKTDDNNASEDTGRAGAYTCEAPAEISVGAQHKTRQATRPATALWAQTQSTSTQHLTEISHMQAYCCTIHKSQDTDRD